MNGRRAPGEHRDMGESNDHDSYLRAVEMMRGHYCKKDDQELCSKIQHLQDELKRGAAQNNLSDYKKLLATEKSAVCNGATAHKTRCKAFTLISDRLPSKSAAASEQPEPAAPPATQAESPTHTISHGPDEATLTIPKHGVRVNIDKANAHKVVSVSINGDKPVAVKT